MGLVEEKNIGGKFIKVQTNKGLELGIETIEKTSPSGYEYTLLMYPPKVQKIIMDSYIK